MRIILVLIFLYQLVIFDNQLLIAEEGLPLYYWRTSRFVNFGDYMSLKVVERILGQKVRVSNSKDLEKKMLAIGSILAIARDGDVVWGSGMNGKKMSGSLFALENSLDIRAVRGPLTRAFIKTEFKLEVPEIYGDPALLIPYLFPEFVKPKQPLYDYIIIPHYSDIEHFPREGDSTIVYATDFWKKIIRKVISSRLVISSSLHGLIIAEAYGIPAIYLRLSESEPLFKFYDYYLGTNRDTFKIARSVEEALEMGGESPFECDLQKLYDSFPFDLWPSVVKKEINFNS
ncbi:polysaccharide pyruvyl transferase family protein [Chlamydiales bacterium]|nr:polysaccharide pyruvyl transferase family protein [Chlamydiales bacterium]